LNFYGWQGRLEAFSAWMRLPAGPGEKIMGKLLKPENSHVKFDIVGAPGNVGALGTAVWLGDVGNHN